MAKMLFTSQQPNVLVIPLPNGKTDVTVLTNETKVVIKNEDDNSSTIQFQYDGNQFRTVYPITEEDVKSNIEKYLNYSSEGEPTLEQLKREQDAIDAYTLQLIEEGVISWEL